MVVKIGIIKVGNIATSLMVDLILDERADREDIDVQVVSTGSKMGNHEITNILSFIDNIQPDLLIFISPNPNAKNPKEAIKTLNDLNMPTIIIGDKPGKKIIPILEEYEMGYLIVMGDPMIGARREYLDPTEMVLFNSHILEILAVSGTFRLITKEIDTVINQIKNNDKIELPNLVLTSKNVIESAGFRNDYAKAKATAAYNMATQVSDLNSEACFKINNPEEYIPQILSAHEMVKKASRLASQAREIEKSNNSVYRTPHMRDGSTIEK